MREVWQNQEILERDGLNELEKPPKPTLLLLFLMQRLAAQGSLVPRGVLVGVEPGSRSSCG